MQSEDLEVGDYWQLKEPDWESLDFEAHNLTFEVVLGFNGIFSCFSILAITELTLTWLSLAKELFNAITGKFCEICI